MKTDFGLQPGDLKSICSMLAKEPTVEKAILFGSRAKGNYRPGSDVDIALKGKDLSARAVTNVNFQLNEETIMPYQFDVLHYHRIKEPDLLEHINRAGIILYENTKHQGVAGEGLNE